MKHRNNIFLYISTYLLLLSFIVAADEQFHAGLHRILKSTRLSIRHLAKELRRYIIQYIVQYV